MPHIPSKRFGQHFLTDRNIIDKIVRAADLEASSVVMEIGPGLGHLTRALSETGARVIAIEIDRELTLRLRSEFADMPNVYPAEGDILSRSPSEWLEQANLQPPYTVVANLPYYITSAILRYLLEAAIPPIRLVVMVQREVAQQITAKPPHSNLLAVSIQFYGIPRTVGIVPAGAFNPRPKVDSAFVRIEVQPRRTDIDSEHFFQIVRAGFSAKRKQLRNALANGLGIPVSRADQLLAKSNIDPTRRAETLILDEWVHLARNRAK